MPAEWPQMWARGVVVWEKIGAQYGGVNEALPRGILFCAPGGLNATLTVTKARLWSDKQAS